MKLTAKQKKGIQTWLQLAEQDKPDYCPFSYPTDKGECLDVCPELFPRLRRRIGGNPLYVHWCPCQNYTLAHVIRVARKAVD